MRLLVNVSVLVAALGSVALAQRPDNTSICDFYAIKQYGSNSTESQFKLIQRIVAFAFGGGAGLQGASETSTGILNPGTFQGTPVYLRSWFDGSKATTNLNNQAVGINWLDSGAQEPLHAFLNGTTDTVDIPNTTNQYRLFTHFNTAFGFVFGCTLVRTFPKLNESGAPISLAYVHKFMQLNQTHLGYFINQLTTSAKYYGFSETDAGTLSTFMNSRYNVRCAPAVNGQLFSLCQATECPLAAPSPDCASYVNLLPGGNSTGPQQTGGPSGTAPTGTPTPTGTGLGTPTETTAQLSTGAIAGIAIGGAAVVLAAIGLVLFFRRKPQPQVIAVPYPPSAPSQGWASPAHPSYAGTHPHTSFAPSANPHDSMVAGSGYFAPKPDDPEMAQNYRASSPPQNQPIQELAEMESPSGPRIHSPIAAMVSPAAPGTNTMQSGSGWEPPSTSTPTHNPHASWDLGQSPPAQDNFNPNYSQQQFQNTQQMQQQPTQQQQQEQHQQNWGNTYR